MMTPREPVQPSIHNDAAARNRAAHTHDVTFCIEAAAGTGKTTLIVEKITDLVIKHAVPIRNAVAITFTEKAALELKERMRDKLTELSEASDPERSESPDLKKLADAALEEFDLAEISTIHSFCQRILREYPFEAGIDPGFTVMDGVVSKRFFYDVWHEWLTSIMQMDPDALADRDSEFRHVAVDLRDLFLLGLTADDLTEFVQTSYQERDILDMLETYEYPAEEAVCSSGEMEQVVDLLNQLSEFISPELLVSGSVDDGQELTRRLLANYEEMQALTGAIRDRYFLEELRMSSAKGAQKNWLNKENCVAMKALQLELRDALDKVARKISYVYASKAVRVAKAFKEHLDKLKSQAGLVDFFDLLYITRELLKNDLEVRRSLSKRFRYILIDEFQDTDPLQAEVVFFLADGAFTSTNWHEVELIPGKLTIVGDPKQSIYKFRRADIELYASAKRLVESSGGELLTISRNFRTVPNVIEWVNQTFEPLFSALSEYPQLQTGETDPADPPNMELISDLQADYVPLVANRDVSKDSGVTLLVPPVEHGVGPLQGDWRDAEAGAIASWIKNSVSSGQQIYDKELCATRAIRFGDHTILFMRLTQLESYIRALESAEVPFIVDGGKQFFESREIRSLYFVLRAVTNPSDQHSIVGALRSQFFGISDTDLLTYKVAAGSFNIEHALTLTSLDINDSAQQVRNALLTMLRLSRKRHHVPVDILIETLLNELERVPVAWYTKNGRQSFANTNKLIAQYRAMHQSEPMDLGQFTVWLKEMIDSETSEQLAAAGGDEYDAVKIMSSHKSKGLEFPVVVLADLAGGDSGKARSVELTAHRRSGRAGFKLPLSIDAAKPSAGQIGRKVLASKDYEELRDLDKLRDKEEFKRMCYVSATRAREQLILPLFIAQEKATSSGFGQYLSRILPRNSEERDGVDMQSRVEGYVTEFSYPLKVVESSQIEGPVFADAGYKILKDLAQDHGNGAENKDVKKVALLIASAGKAYEADVKQAVSRFTVTTPVELSKFGKASTGTQRSSEAMPGMPDPKSAGKGTGTGTLVGTIVHNALSKINLNTDHAKFLELALSSAQEILDKGELSEADRTKAFDAVSLCLKNFWKTQTSDGKSFVPDILLKADEIISEMTLQTLLRKGEIVIGRPVERDTYVDGRLDLVMFSGKHAWVIELKTDANLRPETLSGYEDQVKIYCQILSKELAVSGSEITVSGGYLLLLREAKLHPVLI